MKNKNHILYYVQTSLYQCAYIIAMGTVFQTFLLENGINETRVSFCVSMVQLIQTLFMLLISKAAENIKNVIKGVSIGLFSFSVLFASMLLICINKDFSVDTKYIILFAASGILNMFLALYSILSYKLPHHIMNINDYGKISGQSGMFSGVLGVAFSFIITLALARLGFTKAMFGVALVGIIMSLTAGTIGFTYTPLEVNQNIKKTEKINIFRYKPFYQLLIPNFARGISTGIINLIAVIGYYSDIIGSTGSSVLVTLSQIATIIGCQTYSLIASKHKNGLLCFISGIGIFIALPLMMVKGNILFSAFYFIAYIFNIYISYATPVQIAECIDYNCLGQFTAWRMGIFTFGTAIGGMLVPILLKSIGSLGTLFVGGITMLICGIGYYIFELSTLKTYNKNSVED